MRVGNIIFATEYIFNKEVEYNPEVRRWVVMAMAQEIAQAAQDLRLEYMMELASLGEKWAAIKAYNFMIDRMKFDGSSDEFEITKGKLLEKEEFEKNVRKDETFKKAFEYLREVEEEYRSRHGFVHNERYLGIALASLEGMAIKYDISEYKMYSKTNGRLREPRIVESDDGKENMNLVHDSITNCILAAKCWWDNENLRRKSLSTLWALALKYDMDEKQKEDVAALIIFGKNDKVMEILSKKCEEVMKKYGIGKVMQKKKVKEDAQKFGNAITNIRENRRRNEAKKIEVLNVTGKDYRQKIEKMLGHCKLRQEKPPLYLNKHGMIVRRP